MKSILMNEFPLDDVGGILTDYLERSNHDVHALDKYCKENNRSPETLTDEELKQFEVK